MASFPGALATFAGFVASHTLSVDNHAAQHNLEQGEIVAVQTKVGTGSSTPVASTVLRSASNGTSTWGQVVLTTDVTGVLPIINGGTGSTTATAAATALAVEMGKLLFPVGCVYTETTGTNPATTFGFGIWTAFGAGRVLVGNGTSDQAFAAGATGGESNHTLSIAEMPAHTHTIHDPDSFVAGAQNLTLPAAGGTGMYVRTGSFSPLAADSTGGGTSHNNLQPYIVAYFWKRTA